MADEVSEGYGSDIGIASHREIKSAGNSIDDFISSLPDEILQHVLSFLPTKLATRTSVLSKRWKPIWSKTPSLYFDRVRPTEISRALTYYKAPKLTSFYISTASRANAREIDNWVEFAISHNAEKLSFTIICGDLMPYGFPDSFYVSSSLKELELRLYNFDMNIRCSVFWKSLKNLSLRACGFCNESFPKIISGCPVLESLELELCYSLKLIDLSKSPRLRRFEIDGCDWFEGSPQIVIVAPHLHSLTLRNSRSPSSLVEVSSLTEATLDNVYELAEPLTTDYLREMLKMLEKLQNVKKLTIGEGSLQILSLAELCGVTFPTFKFKSLTLKTMVYQSVVPGIKRLLQNSHGLKKLTLHRMECSSISEKELDSYLNSQGLNHDQCKDQTFSMFWGKSTSTKLVALFLELVLKTTKTLETIIVRVEEDLGETRFEELRQLASTLSRSNNVSIAVLK